LLPRGVGLTIDVSTGELGLPVWKFEGSQTTWTDPSSKEVFIVPSGASLTTGNVTKENVATIRVFKTEEELVNVWEKGYHDGNWLGGEFGTSKSVLDLYNKFFSKEQSTSINQHPKSLYQLKLENGWENNLNEYAKAALSSLPEAYDFNIYSRFMDTWGTHIATDTLVGGMLEQQVVMKSCMWQSPYLTGGLSEKDIEDYLKMDLAKAPPQDSFYLSRRQMSIDHRVGGNPEISDQQAWLDSLAQNPALIKIYSHVSWPLVAKQTKLVNSQVIANLDTAIKKRMSDREKERQDEEEETKKKRVQELQGPREVVAMVGHGRRGTISPELETGKYLTLKGYKDCPPGLSYQDSIAKCNTGLYVHSWNHVELNEPLRYERNSEGSMRSVRCFDKDSSGRCITHSGPWVRDGCSLQPYANGTERPFHTPVPDKTVVAMVCADCQIITAGFANDAILKCACPGYSQTKLWAKENHTHPTKALRVSKPGAIEEDIQNWSVYGKRLVSQKFYHPNDLKTGMQNFKQCDPQWACYPYHGHANLSTCNTTVCGVSNNICISGCGITSLAMILTFWHYDYIIPPKVADILVAEGFRDDLSDTKGATCNGVSQTAICFVSNMFHLGCNITTSFTVLDSWLKENKYDGDSAPVIAHVRHKAGHTCKFTSGGHYIVITGIESVIPKMVYHVLDPNSNAYNRTYATVDDFNECQLVAFISILPLTMKGLVR